MKTVTREQWTTALRSGDYKQAKGFLYDGKDGYCCLGVLGKLTGAETLDGKMGMNFGDGSGFRGGFIPERVSEMTGINYIDTHRLMAMNDEGDSFAKIADYIDKLPFKDPADG